MADKNEPTAEDIRWAVRNYLGPRETQAKAHRLIHSWGDAALPHLMAWAQEPDNGMDGLHIVFCIHAIRTKEAMRSLLDIVKGQTKIDPIQGVGQLIPIIHPEVPGMLKHLEDFEDFKPTIFRLASNDSWLTRSIVAEVMAAMNWIDGVPLIEKMLDDENLHLREKAASAIEKLTGTKPDARRPALSFPKSEPQPNLITQIGCLPKSGWMTSAVAFDLWFDGRCGLLQWRGGVIHVFDADLQPRAALTQKRMVHDMVMAPYHDEELQLIAVVSDKRSPNGSYVASLDQNSETL